MPTYGTSVIPSDQITVESGGTVNISTAFNATVGIVGNMDTSNGSATTGDVERVSSVSEAQNLFGEDSELYRAVDIAYENGVSDVYTYGVPETNTTESFSSTQSGTLSEVPVDPNVCPEHEITAQDTTEGTSVDVSIVYGDGSPSAPSEGNTINLNPVNGEWNADESSSYDITFDHADFADAFSAISREDVRYLAVCTEDESVIDAALTEATDDATDFDFYHVVGGIMPSITPSNYSDSLDNFRASVTADSRGYMDAAETEEVRTSVGLAAKLTSKDFGDSTTYESIDGIVSLRGKDDGTDYTTTELGDFISEQVTPIREAGDVQVVKDVTTSTDVRFERHYAVEIIDEASELSHLISQQFVGELNVESNREALADRHKTAYEDMASERPPLLDDYTVNVSEGDSVNEVDVEVGLDVVDVMDTIDVQVSVGDVITNTGAA